MENIKQLLTARKQFLLSLEKDIQKCLEEVPEPGRQFDPYFRNQADAN